jgi:regulator of protease activity HflC (stomatin/prohibitin superfamily)
MALFIGIVLIVFTIVLAFVGSYLCSEDNSVAGGICWVLAVICLISFVIVPFSLHQVDETEVLVIKEYGKVKEVITDPGMEFDFWLGKSYERIDTKTQDLKIEAMTYSSDAQVMNVSLAVQHKFLGGEAKKIIKDYGSTKALTERITSVLTETPKAVLSTRTAMEIIANRSSITPEIREAIQNALGDKYPVEVTNVVILNIDFSDAFEQAVEEKMIAEQNKLKADFENEKKVATAKANAEAKILEAEAEAKSNELLEKSITDKTLRDKYLDKWDGKLPSTMVGEDTMLMVPTA